MYVIFIFLGQKHWCFYLAFLSFFSFSIFLKNKIKLQKTCQNELVSTFNRAHLVQRLLFAPKSVLFGILAIFLKKSRFIGFFISFYNQQVYAYKSDRDQKKELAVSAHTIRVYAHVGKKATTHRIHRKELSLAFFLFLRTIQSDDNQPIFWIVNGISKSFFKDNRVLR